MTTHANTSTIPADLTLACRDLFDGRPVLIGLDFDGVLAPLVDDPTAARALPGTLELAVQLAQTRGVTVALISGRARADLATRTEQGPNSPLVLIGSHGAEFDMDLTSSADAAAAKLLTDLRARLGRIAGRHPGTRLEHKPAAAVLHTRRAATAESARTATAAAVAELSELDGVHLIRGKDVVEAAVTTATKGIAVHQLRARLGPDCRVLFLGDDLTDETVFRLLGPADIGVKVGPGPTAAHFRLSDPFAVQLFLRQLCAIATKVSHCS